MNKQVQSKSRVSLYGEVYTSEREVNDMLDLVKDETERLDSRFLEPACGDGNFLFEVLSRKLDVLKRNYKKNQYEFEKNAIVVVGSLYGIDILEDNIIKTRERLLSLFLNIYNNIFKKNVREEMEQSINFIICKNIIHGDALTLKEIKSSKALIFSEWAIINNKVKRRDFTFSDLIEYAPFEKGTLFSDMGDEVNIPRPVNEFEMKSFYKIYEDA